MTNHQFGIWPLEWDVEESRACVGQAIVVDGNTVWLSCMTFLLKGMIGRDSTGKPQNITITKSYMEALDDPRKVHDSYGHIGDGSLVVLNSGQREIWFGLEDGEWPRELPAAIVRYDAETLEFRGLHPHPTMKIMAWLAVDSVRNLAYTSLWTDVESIAMFDIERMVWANGELNLGETPEYADGINFIQGADMMGDQLLVMADDFRSSLISINVANGHVDSIWHLGLGNEREGIAVSGDYILSLGNRWKTWENHSFAEILCLPMLDNSTITSPTWQSTNAMAISTSSALFIGAILGAGASCLIRRLRNGAPKMSPHIEYELSYRDNTVDSDGSLYADANHETEVPPVT